MCNFKEKFLEDLAKYPKIIESSILYDCSLFFKMVKEVEDIKKKKRKKN